jgi:hypothetical protein
MPRRAGRAPALSQEVILLGVLGVVLVLLIASAS